MDSGLLVLVVVLVVVVVAAFWLWRRFQVQPSRPTTEVHTIAEQLPSDDDTELLNQNPTMAQVAVGDVVPGVMAILEIQQGPDAIVNGINVGRQVEIRDQRVTIGRSPKQATIQLYNVDEASSVSRLHATLEFHRTFKRFQITDEGSSSGTRVGGKIIMPHKGHSLKDGDVIELGKMDQQGAILRFRTTFDAPETANPSPTQSKGQVWDQT